MKITKQVQKDEHRLEVGERIYGDETLLLAGMLPNSVWEVTEVKEQGNDSGTLEVVYTIKLVK